MLVSIVRFSILSNMDLNLKNTEINSESNVQHSIIKTVTNNPYKPHMNPPKQTETKLNT